MVHGIFSAIFALALSCIDPFLCFLPAAFYLGREHSEAEYRYMKKHKTNRENSPWYMGFLPESWTLDGVLDCAIPAVVCVVVFLMALMYGV
jgi:hypothetical protein